MPCPDCAPIESCLKPTGRVTQHIAASEWAEFLDQLADRQEELLAGEATVEMVVELHVHRGKHRRLIFDPGVRVRITNSLTGAPK